MTASQDDTMTPEELRVWLQQEIRDLTKAFQLRMKDATDFVTACTLGEMSRHDAKARLIQYQTRWGDSPIPGVPTNEKMTDEDIVEQLDRQRLRLPNKPRPGSNQHVSRVKTPSPKGLGLP